jgi:hypothetical protein
MNQALHFFHLIIDDQRRDGGVFLKVPLMTEISPNTDQGDLYKKQQKKEWYIGQVAKKKPDDDVSYKIGNDQCQYLRVDDFRDPLDMDHIAIVEMGDSKKEDVVEHND